MASQQKAYIDHSFCVACGCCLKVCPKSAIRIHHGMFAKVNPTQCVGCGKCVSACPASVIKVEVIE